MVSLSVHSRNVTQKANYYNKPVGLSVVSVDGDVITGNSLPRFGVLCVDTAVQGNPHDGFDPLYILSKGETVRLREQSHGSDRGWVMIAPAEWIKGNSLCGW